MNSGKTIFSQLMDFLPQYDFSKCVERYHGNYKVKSFSCWEQFLCMAFAQLTYRESLRDIQACLRAAQLKLYHMGIRGKVSRNTLANANSVRDWRIYADFGQLLIGQARSLYVGEEFGVQLEQTAYALDATTIDLCLNLFPWALFRKRKGAIKLHTLLDLRGSIPALVLITQGKTHDVNILDDIIIEPGAIYIMDRAYVDFARLHRIDQYKAFFHHTSQKQFRFQASLLPPYRQVRWLAMRPDNRVERILREEKLPGKAAPNSLSGRRNGKTFCVFNKQFYPSSVNDSGTLSMPLASGIVFQVDQTALANQGILWNIGERGEDTGMDSYHYLRPCGHSKEALGSGPEPLHNFTDFECDTFRENPHFTGFDGGGLQYYGGGGV